MLPPVRSHGFRFLFLLSCALLGACGGRLRLGFDTERVGQMRQAAALREAGGLAVSSSRIVASRLALLVPTLAAGQ